jgi:ActR/RegA family two-component response regulator
MVQFMAGFKGEGKTRKLIEMANEHVKKADGNLIFIDDDNRHTRDISREIRFINAGKAVMETQQEFCSFVWGILTMNSDIQHIYVDGITNILAKPALNNDTMVALKTRLESLSREFEVDFTISVHYDRDILPEEIKELLI